MKFLAVAITALALLGFFFIKNLGDAPQTPSRQADF